MIKCASCSKLLPPTSYRFIKDSKRLGLVLICKYCQESETKKDITKAKKAACQKLVSKEDKKGTQYSCNKCKKTAGVYEFYYKLSTGYLYINEVECRQCTKDRMRYNAFKIDPSEYQSMLEAQDNKCAICRIDMEEYVKTSQYNGVFPIDHCHSTGKIRGLLCAHCNRGLGYFRDSPENLQNAIEYINKNLKE